MAKNRKKRQSMKTEQIVLALLSALMISSGALDVSAQVLFNDPFTSGPVDPTNVNATVATRQSGSLAPISYLYTPDAAAEFVVSNNVFVMSAGGSAKTTMSPNYNFTQYGNLSISVDLKPAASNAGWENFCIGTAAPNAWHFENPLEFFFAARDGSGYVFDGGATKATFGASAPDANGFWNLRFDISTGTSSITNGLATVNAYVGGTLVASYTRATAFTGNYISLVGSAADPANVTFWDNLQVTTVPEPTTVCLLGLGGLLVFRGVRRVQDRRTTLGKDFTR